MRRRDDGGFTLIEAVIAIMVLSIAVVALVAGLTTMISLSQHHRGHAVVETAARSFGQAVQATAQSSVPLASSIGDAAGDTSITVTDASTLPEPGSNTYLLLEREVVRLTGIDRSTGVLTVVRGAGGTTRAAHVVSATSKPVVVPHLRCPSAADLTPPAGSYAVASGTTPVITGVQYVEPSTGQFTSTAASSCLTAYVKDCPSGTLLPECGTGFFRVLISVTTTGDARLKGVDAKTQVLVRSGSPA